MEKARTLIDQELLSVLAVRALAKPSAKPKAKGKANAKAKAKAER